MTSKPKPSSISGKAAQIERKAQLAKQRQQQQQIILFGGAIALLAIVVIGIFISSRPSDVTFPTDYATNYAGIPASTTTAGIKGVSDPYPIAFPILGDPNAPVRIEEISSFSCPYCMQYHNNTVVKILDEIKAGRASFVYIPTTHTGDYSQPGIMAVTSAAVCALQQNKFWEMQDILFDWQARYAEGTADKSCLAEAASTLGLDMNKFNACLASPDTLNYINASNDYADKQRHLVGTPSIFLFANGKQITNPQQASSETPGSYAGMALGSLRGITEAAKQS